MRLSPTGNLSNQGRNERVIRSKPKHKKLDLICEKKYNQNRLKIESPKLSEVNDDTSEVRRSSRVRRAPSVLDASPAPPKKRKITERNGDGSSRSGRDRYHRSMKEEDSGEWNSRLRTRPRKVTFMNGDCDSSPRSKKNLFGHSDGVKEEDSDLMDSRLDDKKGLVGETSMVVQPKRPGRIKATNIVTNEEISLGNIDKDEEETNELHVVKDNNNGFLSDNEAPIESLQQGNDISLPVTSDSKDNANNIVQSPEQIKPVEHEQPESNEKENQTLHEEVTSTPENHVQEENTNVVDEHKKHSPNHRDHKPRIKKGRCCGMCGGGTDGKPPKILVNDGAGSDNEAYSGSSSSEEPTYDIWDGFGDEPGWLGRLLGPINDRFGIAGIWVHQQCAVWSPEVYFAGLGCLKNVRSALFRGRVLKCSRCGRRGATIGCRVDRCPKTYHLPCARVNGCIFDHRKFLIACTDHRHLFQPHGAKLLKTLKKLKTKKLKSQLRKTSNEASRKDHEAEENFLNGEDEEFLKRERKRLHRDISRIAPVFIGGPNPSQESPIPFQGFDSVGGLHPVIQSLKEVVILPLLYPEFFQNINLTPPRGVLLHGHPGTGKTLLVRSLIGSCARGDKRIAYFARKGADCLGKYVGDAERQLRLLFQVAEKSQPSIIFFDEIDGLAPSRTRVQDQTHNSVVSTLLALLDGLKSRGSVIVIGATNRPDAIDPALRRPGRFDREIYFPLPNLKDREEILSLHTKKWPSVIDKKTLSSIAKKTEGFAGADLQALCTQTAIIALKRNCPWEKLLLCAEEKGQFGKRPVLPDFRVCERDWLDALSRAPPPCSRREAGMAANEIAIAVLPVYLLPCLIQSVTKLVLLLYLDGRVSLPGLLLKTAELIKKVIVSVLDKRKESSDSWWLKVEELVKDAEVAGEVERALVHADVLVGNDGGVDEVENGFMYNKKKLGFCVLICGNSGSGQRHLASCVLQCFVGNAVLQKVDLATMLHEGAGDMVQGLSQILVRCAGVGSCMIFMPRIDLWAIETYHQDVDEENEKTKKTEIPPDLKASGLWSSFVEQAESIFISSSLMILATSEVPFEMLPLRIKDFFGKTNKQNLNPSSHIGSTIPRFSVNVDQSFDRELVIASSAKKLSNDVARFFVELIHQKDHVHDDKSLNADVDNDTVMEEDYTFQNQTPITPPPTKKEEKGKSNLMLAISTFGYQILQYPHFAELCWVTSKLKQGPSTEISGPWKGWPFNSCIIRPSETNNVKSKEKYGFVRGLIAVGLMAYRGVYSSLREVSGDVRKVLEVLSEEINARVEGGKDRRQFGRVLSQVACLEDMVNSWVYTLQSLEIPQVMDSKTDVVQGDDPMDIPTNQEESMKENTEQFADISKEEDKPPIDHVTCVDEFTQVLETQESTSFKDPQIALLLKDQNGVVPEPSNFQSSENLPEPKPTEHSNGFAHSESVNIIPDGPCTSVDHTVPNKTPPKDQVCLYKFCPKCMSNLRKIIQKNLTSEWNKSCDVTTEEVHETVTWVSLNLHKNIRTFFEKQETGTCCHCEAATCHGDDVSGVPESELELIYKNGVVGVLEGSESDVDVCFHCKFERLCLCDVIEYIVRTSSSSSSSSERTKHQPSGSGCI